MQKEDIGDKINELHEVAILYSRSTKKEFKEVEGDVENYTSYGVKTNESFYRIQAVQSKNLIYYLAVTSSRLGSVTMVVNLSYSSLEIA